MIAEKLAPRDVELRLLLARLTFAAGQRIEAIAVLGEALKLPKVNDRLEEIGRYLKAFEGANDE